MTQVLVMRRLSAASRECHGVPHSLTVADVIAHVLPDLPETLLQYVRVLVAGRAVAREAWGRFCPAPNDTVVVRLLPGDQNLRTILSLVITVAAIAAGQFYAPALAGALIPFGTATAGTIQLVGATITAVAAVGGNLLLNTLIPVRQKTAETDPEASPTVQGFQNALNPGGAIPLLLGTHRVAPPYASRPTTENLGDDSYATAAFNWGYGALGYADFKFGDTPLGNYIGVEQETRPGLVGDVPLSLTPYQILEKSLNDKLLGGVPNTGTPTPIMRVTAFDVFAIGIDVLFPSGLYYVDKEGDRHPGLVVVQIRYRLVGAVPWTTITLPITTESGNPVRRTHLWTVPTRGQYEVELTRTTDDHENIADVQAVDQVFWVTLRSMRPEYIIDFPFPLALSALRVKASNQLSGTISDYNAIVSMNCPDWDVPTQTWITRATSNPASLTRFVMQCNARYRPRLDAELDLPAFQAWHVFCTAKGLTYNRFHDFEAWEVDVENDVAAAGRATVYDRGDKWSVVIDTIKTQVIGHVGLRNSWDFKGRTEYPEHPDAFRVTFHDQTNNYLQKERVIPRPGLVGDPETFVELPMPGVTDPIMVWKEARRRWYEVLHRRHTYTVAMDYEGMIYSRGDLIMLSNDVLDVDHQSCRVRTVVGRQVALDQEVTMENGVDYSIRFRLHDGSTMLRSVLPAATAGDRSAVTVLGDVSGLEEECLALFGKTVNGESIEVIVKDIEVGENLTFRLRMVDHAPQIETLTDAEVPDAWNGRVGFQLDPSTVVPSVPFIFILDTVDNLITAVAYPGASSGAVPVSYIFAHRLSGGGAFTEVAVTAAAASTVLSGYVVGNIIEVKVKAVSFTGYQSAFSAVKVYYVHTGPSFDSSTTTFDSSSVTWDTF